MIRLRIILLLHLRIHLIQRLIHHLLRVVVLIRKRDGHRHAREVEQVNHRRVAVVLEAVVADGCGGRNGGDDGVEGLAGAEVILGFAPLREVLGLVGPFVKVNVPELVEVEFGVVGVEEVFNVGDGGFAGSGDVSEDVLFL